MDTSTTAAQVRESVATARREIVAALDRLTAALPDGYCVDLIDVWVINADERGGKEHRIFDVTIRIEVR